METETKGLTHKLKAATEAVIVFNNTGFGGPGHPAFERNVILRATVEIVTETMQELLEACKFMVSDEGTWDEAKAKMEAAIAKAEGETNG